MIIKVGYAYGGFYLRRRGGGKIGYCSLGFLYTGSSSEAEEVAIRAVPRY